MPFTNKAALMGAAGNGGPDWSGAIDGNTKLMVPFNEDSTTDFVDLVSSSNVTLTGTSTVSSVTDGPPGVDRCVQAAQEVGWRTFKSPGTMAHNSGDWTHEIFYQQLPGADWFGIGPLEGSTANTQPPRFYGSALGGWYIIANGGNVTSGGGGASVSTWYHLCFMRASGVWYAFFDGSQILSWTETGTAFTGSDYVSIGQRHETGSGDGYRISSWRVSDTARYATSGFTVPSPFYS